MTRPPLITFEAVRRSCLKMMGDGEWPTNQALYEALGRKGSMGTIQKHKTAFFESLKDKGFEALPASLPKDLVPLIEEWWSLSVRHAGEAHADERKKLLEQLDQQESIINDLNEAIVTLNHKIGHRDGVIRDLERDRDALISEVESGKALVSELQKRIAGLEERVEGLRVDHAARVDELTRLYEADIQGYQDRISTLKQELTASLDREKMEVARSERNADHFLLQINTERERCQSMEASFKAVVERLESELTIYRAREERLVRGQQEAENRAERYEKELEDLQQRFDDQMSVASNESKGDDDD